MNFAVLVTESGREYVYRVCPNRDIAETFLQIIARYGIPVRIVPMADESERPQ